MGYNLLSGGITYLYRGYTPVTKYHGHPSTPDTQCMVHSTWNPKMGSLVLIGLKGLVLGGPKKSWKKIVGSRYLPTKNLKNEAKVSNMGFPEILGEFPS